MSEHARKMVPFSAPEDIDIYLDALEDEIQFNRCVAKSTLELHGEQSANSRTLLMMILTLLIEGAPSPFLYNLEKKFLVDVVFLSLKEPNDITLITNAVILLQHLQQNCMTVAVDGNECMDVLYKNSKRHTSPKFIEVSLDLVMLGAPDYGLSHPKSVKALEFCIRIHSLLSNNSRKNSCV
ncbi:uncharacterized protein LOC123312947 [Coccinella septempunctata]|uniref:uncharacterized protein LOC123312947 n=1 Tax=Coccinella septempunctata TaxID=41139 RepID=UPI001D072885|nr:uncharacterized protein LOC123312947 [Coccinella septempunctata]